VVLLDRPPLVQEQVLAESEMIPFSPQLLLHVEVGAVVVTSLLLMEDQGEEVEAQQDSD